MKKVASSIPSTLFHSTHSNSIFPNFIAFHSIPFHSTHSHSIPSVSFHFTHFHSIPLSLIPFHLVSTQSQSHVTYWSIRVWQMATVSPVNEGSVFIFSGGRVLHLQLQRGLRYATYPSCVALLTPSMACTGYTTELHTTTLKDMLTSSTEVLTLSPSP